MLLLNRRTIASALSPWLVSLAMGACAAEEAPGDLGAADLTAIEGEDGGLPSAADSDDTSKRLGTRRLPEDDGFSYVYRKKVYDYGGWSRVATGNERMIAVAD